MPTPTLLSCGAAAGPGIAASLGWRLVEVGPAIRDIETACQVHRPALAVVERERDFGWRAVGSASRADRLLSSGHRPVLVLPPCRSQERAARWLEREPAPVG